MTASSLRKAGALLVVGALAIAGCSGDKGKDGNSCSVQDLGGSSVISCSDGTSVTVNDGAPGDPGPNASCTVTPNGDGTRTIRCSDGTTIVVRDAVVDYATMTDADKADLEPSLVVTNVTFAAGKPVVAFKVSDRHGNGVKGIVEATTTFRVAIMKLAPAGVNVSANETWINYIASSPTSTSSYEQLTTTGAQLVANGDGTYVFKLAKDVSAGTGALAYDASLVHRVVVLAYQSGNPYAPMNAVFDFVPATGEVKSPDASAAVDGTACLQCHTRFRAKAGGTGAFHGGARYDVRGCVMCHNDQRRFTTISGTSQNDSYVDPSGVWTGNLAIVNGEGFLNLPVFIHKIHMGEELHLTGGKYPGVAMPYEVTYPQDVRNCAKCHRAPAGKADNWKSSPSRRACGACHDDRNFGSTTMNARVAHSGGARTSDITTVSPAYTGCNGCHAPDDIAAKHEPVALPVFENYYANTTAYSANVNAGWVPATNQLPPEAIKITYEVDSVTTVAASGGGWNAQVKFKFTKQAPGDAAPVDVVFNSTTASSEIMDNFVNSPSVYVVFALPQDGIAAPADFNASFSETVKNLWKGSNGSLTAGTGGWYTAKLTKYKVPGTATMLTGAIGYSYSLSSSPPLTQIKTKDGQPLNGYPYNANATGDITCGPGQSVGCVGATATNPIVLKPKMGGLVVAAADKWKTASGHTARRTLVSNDKCNACHDQLGVTPTFHAGQRNDAPTCSFCHTPNRTSSGWSASAKEFVHGIHAAAKREWDYTWHASKPDSGYWDITFPGILRNCEVCHVAGSYAFSTSAENLLLSTVAVYSSTAPADYAMSHFLPEGVTSTSFPGTAAANFSDAFGFVYSTSDVKVSDGRTNVTQGTWNGNTCTVGSPCAGPCTADLPCTLKTCSLTSPCETEANTYASTPIAAVCASCHDTQLALGHYATFGGKIYVPRPEALAAQEQCLMCHGSGKVAAIDDVHMSK